MQKLLVSIFKEGLLLLRDIEGVILMFIMPLILVVVMTSLQHKTFQNLSESKIPVVVLNYDKDSLGSAFIKGIEASGVFEVAAPFCNDSSQLKQARQQVAEGKYQMGILIPQQATATIKKRALGLVQQQLPGALTQEKTAPPSESGIQLFFDPITKASFRQLVRSMLNEFVARTETHIIFTTYSKVLDAITNQRSNISFPEAPVIAFSEVPVSEYTGGILPNAVQHNVPAWTLFGMFLICIPVAGSIIKERNDGCLARIKTIPVSYWNFMAGKTTVYLIICLLQALCIVLVGMYLMPLFGLPKLQIEGNWMALFLISLASAFAATGYGIAIGTIAATQTQASTFGSVSTVILAAIGGVWIPVMVMPDVMRIFSKISPLNWGVNGYYDVFLRNANSLEILPDTIKLILFYFTCIAISIFFRKYQADK